jgi:hypothetical protein
MHQLTNWDMCFLSYLVGMISGGLVVAVGMTFHMEDRERQMCKRCQDVLRRARGLVG